MRQTVKTVEKWIVEHWQQWTATDNRWLTVPVTVASLLVLLVLVKSCQGIVYGKSKECKIQRLGYPIEEARTLAAVLSDEQADSLITINMHDTIAYCLTQDRYFIVDNFVRYLSYHHRDTTASAQDIIAAVNVGADRKWYEAASPCDTSRDMLMLVNKFHYLPEDYQRNDMVDFEKKLSYGKNKAAKPAVEAFYKMQKECKDKTDKQLIISSAYRSHDDQKAEFKHYHDKLVARAGYSEHQTGLSLDIVSLEHPGKWDFGKAEEGIWMRENCHRFGFILRYPEGKSRITGYDYEPWHLRYVGVEAATRLHDEGITLDEYHAYYLERETR